MSLETIFPDDEIRDEIIDLWKKLKDIGVNEGMWKTLLGLFMFTRSCPDRTKELIEPLNRALDAGINPLWIAWPFIVAVKLREQFEEKGRVIYKAKQLRGKTKKSICKSNKENKFLEILKYRQGQKTDQNYEKDTLSVDQLLEKKFPKEMVRLSSLRTEYYRFRKKYLAPPIEISEEDFVDKALQYYYKHSWQYIIPSKTGDGEQNFIYEFSFGQDRSEFSKIMNEDKFYQGIVNEVKKTRRRRNNKAAKET